MDTLEKFESLPAIKERDDKRIWYIPHLFKIDKWYVVWINNHNVNLVDPFSGDSIDESVNKAYEWYINKGQQS